MWLLVNSRPAVFVSLSMITLFIYSPVCSVWLRLVTPRCSCLCQPCLVLPCLVCLLVAVFLAPPCCVHHDSCRKIYPKTITVRIFHKTFLTFWLREILQFCWWQTSELWSEKTPPSYITYCKKGHNLTPLSVKLYLYCLIILLWLFTNLYF